jgi:YD repeat-containing protein
MGARPIAHSPLGNGEDGLFGAIDDIVDPLGRGTHMEYDEEHHPISTEFGVQYDENLSPTDNGLYRTSAAYHGNGLLRQFTDGRGAETVLAYDNNFDRPKTTKVGGHPPVTTQYDSIGRLKSLTDQVGARTRFTSYDDRGLLLSKKDPLGKTTTYAYDDAGRLEYAIDRNGERTDYAYTPTGKPETISFSDSSQVDFIYDHRDNPTEMYDSLGATYFSYYPDGSIEFVTDPQGPEAAGSRPRRFGCSP